MCSVFVAAPLSLISLMYGATYKNREKTGNTAGASAAVCAVYFADVIRN
jgi:hypothetical protein